MSLFRREYQNHLRVDDLCVTKRCDEMHYAMYNIPVETPLSDYIRIPSLNDIGYLFSKLMGYLIVIGSAIMKFPQILQITKNKSVTGLNLYSFYFECAENMPFIIYNMINGYPFSTYGECVMIFIQAVVLVLLFHYYTKDETITNRLLFRNFSLLCVVAIILCFIPASLQNVIPIISMGFGLSARIPQIYTNFKQGHTGRLSLLTWTFSLVGSTIRIFTTFMEVPDKLVMLMYLCGFSCNLTLVLQILFYWNKTNAILLDEEGK